MSGGYLLPKDSILLMKSKSFALKIIELYKYLSNEKKEYVLSKQVLRSGTSIGANCREANNAQSKADFIFKLAIVQKEASETIYWLELLDESNFLTKEQSEILLNEGKELYKIVTSIILTTKNNINS